MCLGEPEILLSSQLTAASNQGAHQQTHGLGSVVLGLWFSCSSSALAVELVQRDSDCDGQNKGAPAPIDARPPLSSFAMPVLFSVISCVLVGQVLYDSHLPNLAGDLTLSALSSLVVPGSLPR